MQWQMNNAWAKHAAVNHSDRCAHTHTSTFPLWSENKRCEETGKPSTAQTFHFLFYAHFILACWNSSQCAQLLGNAKALIAFYQAFQNSLLCKFSPNECRRRRMYSHTDARYMTHLSLCTPQEEEGTGKALKWTRNSALFSSPPASQLSRHISQFCTWMQRSFVCFVMSVHCNCKPQWDTSVMESVYPIVDILDGGADNILPSGHLRSVITLHLPQPLSFRACRCIKGQGLEKMPDFKITSWLFPFCDSLLTW